MQSPKHPIVLRDADAVARHFASIADSAVELAVVGYLDPEWRLLGATHFTGRTRYVAPSIRHIVRDALAFDAVAAVLVHGHPGGDASPSPADLAFTRRLATTLGAIDVVLVDHLILGGDTTVSLRERGLL
ncbi:JAB domain-containing protein [uncultured Sphingomonas sp.]|uniref:JAB domain-containing protein n=1 Tax=uncultured Sphingomonas sp. TaxID=158754 RepID=UPI0035C9C6BA